MNKKLSSVEIMYHASSYRNLGHITNYECESTYMRPVFCQETYESQLSFHSQNSELTSLIHSRKTDRVFSGDSIQATDLLYLLFNSYSLKTKTGSFTTPQAGGLNVMSIYVIENKKSHWEAYRYDPSHYRLIKIPHSKIQLESLFYTQSVSFKSASHCVIIASQLQLFSSVYLARAYKFACIQAGHIAQNLLLTAITRQIHSVVLGSLIEDEIIKACHFNQDEYPLYSIILGK